MELDLTCETNDGRDCLSVGPPAESKCATGQPIFNLVMSYQASTCARDANQQESKSVCEDSAPINPSASVKIVCVDADAPTIAMDVEPSVVPPGGIVVITNANVGPLPTTVSCVIANSNTNVVLQAVKFDTSGKVELDLKDRYGALEVEGCDDLQCRENFIYKTIVTNNGLRTAQINELSMKLAFEDDPIDLLTRFTPRALPPNTAKGAEDIRRVVDLCTETDLSSTVSVVAVPQGNNFVGSCQDRKTVTLLNDPPCALNVTLNCTGVDTGFLGKNCSDITRETRTRCTCATCARELRFRYTAKQCGRNVAGSGISCTNVTNSPPADRARIVFKRGLADLFEATVDDNEDAIWSNQGNCLPDDFDVFIMRPGTNIVTQTLSINSRCSTPSFGQVLLNDFGALRFSGYTCELNDVHNCFERVAYLGCAENDGTKLRELDSFTLDINGNFIDILRVSGNDNLLFPGESTCHREPTEVKRCQSNSNKAVASAKARFPCNGADVAFDEVSFNIGNPPVPAPTRTPTAGISAAPVRRPPSVPSPPFPTPPSVCPPNNALRPVFAPPLPPGC